MNKQIETSPFLRRDRRRRDEDRLRAVHPRRGDIGPGKGPHRQGRGRRGGRTGRRADPGPRRGGRGVRRPAGGRGDLRSRHRLFGERQGLGAQHPRLGPVPAAGEDRGPTRRVPSSSNPTAAPTSPARPGGAPRPAPPTPSSWPSGRASAPASFPAAASSTATRTSPARSAGSGSIRTSRPSTPPWAVSKPKPPAIPWPGRPGSGWGRGGRRRCPISPEAALEDVTAEIVAAAARAGDALALEIVAEAVALPRHGHRQHRQPPQSGDRRRRRRPVPRRRRTSRARPARGRALGPAARRARGQDRALRGSARTPVSTAAARLAWETVDKTGA